MGQHHGPWGISESGVTNQKAGQGRRERKITREQTNKSGEGNRWRPDRWGGLSRAAAARGQRPHTVDTSVPLPLRNKAQDAAGPHTSLAAAPLSRLPGPGAGTEAAPHPTLNRDEGHQDGRAGKAPGREGFRDDREPRQLRWAPEQTALPRSRARCHPPRVRA